MHRLSLVLKRGIIVVDVGRQEDFCKHARSAAALDPCRSDNNTYPDSK